MSRARRWVMPLLLILAVGRASDSKAYELRTHEAINVGGTLESALDTRLRNEIGFSSGLQGVILDKRVIDWIREGGSLEDRFPRFLNHFHHPLRSPWRNAGLADFPGFGTSSILWGQSPDQEFSWIKARQAYYDALTLPSKSEREGEFAKTFRALGQLMHLIADASVPAHVRNDQHAGGDPYERWVELQAQPRPGETAETARQRLLSTFVPSLIRPDDSFTLKIPILSQDATDAPIPIARLWDTDQYDGTNPSITLSSRIGITEYANANFFSQDTVFANQLQVNDKHFSPFPSSVDVEPWVDPTNNRKYWRKRRVTPDEPQRLVEHLGVVSKRDSWGQSAGVRIEKRGRLDDKVHEDYAKLLLPRAVGYSAALLDYFFRGQLRVFPSWDEDGIWLEIHNRSREEMEGIFELYAVRGEEQERIATFGSVTEPIFVAAFDSSFVNLPETVSAVSPATQWLLVFRGRQGEERPDEARGILGAVAGVVFDLEYVFTVQETFEGPMEQQQCASGRRLDPYEVIGEHLNCSWGPRTVRITGRFVTNQERPIIQRVELFGEGRLIIDGVEQPDGQWLRRDPAQPDPRTFVVEQGAGDLEVTTDNGTLFETSLAEMDGSSGAIKRIAIGHPAVGSTEYLVHAQRSVNLDLDMEDDIDDDEWTLAVFRARQISGVANPTPFTREWVWPERKPEIYWLFAEGVEVDDDDYRQVVIDAFETFPNKDLARARYNQLPAVRDVGDPILEPGAPEVTWHATVERFYRSVEQRFFQLFGITPPIYSIELRGQ